MAAPNDHLLDGEQADIHDELKTIFAEPDKWLNEPNEQLGGLPPRHFLGSPEKEKPLCDLLRAIKHGMAT